MFNSPNNASVCETWSDKWLYTFLYKSIDIPFILVALLLSKIPGNSVFIRIRFEISSMLFPMQAITGPFVSTAKLYETIAAGPAVPFASIPVGIKFSNFSTPLI